MRTSGLCLAGPRACRRAAARRRGRSPAVGSPYHGPTHGPCSPAGAREYRTSPPALPAGRSLGAGSPRRREVARHTKTLAAPTADAGDGHTHHGATSTGCRSTSPASGSWTALRHRSPSRQLPTYSSVSSRVSRVALLLMAAMHRCANGRYHNGESGSCFAVSTPWQKALASRFRRGDRGDSAAGRCTASPHTRARRCDNQRPRHQGREARGAGGMMRQRRSNSARYLRTLVVAAAITAGGRAVVRARPAATARARYLPPAGATARRAALRPPARRPCRPRLPPGHPRADPGAVGRPSRHPCLATISGVWARRLATCPGGSGTATTPSPQHARWRTWPPARPRDDPLPTSHHHVGKPPPIRCGAAHPRAMADRTTPERPRPPVTKALVPRYAW